MKRSHLGRALLVALLPLACDGSPDGPTAELATAPVLSKGAGVVHGASQHFTTHLTGSEEVPPVDTRAQGQAIFRLHEDGEAIHYRLIVANIDNVLMAHLHLAPEGVNGPVVVWLYPDAPPPSLIPGRVQGVLAEGTITAGDLVGPLAGESLAALLDAIRAENVYVNVHTTEHRGGEIRGQID